ncbi:MAG: hypothetical protein ACLQDY_20675 [Streptosporangiaceae bacterium]
MVIEGRLRAQATLGIVAGIDLRHLTEGELLPRALPADRYRDGRRARAAARARRPVRRVALAGQRPAVTA